MGDALSAQMVDGLQELKHHQGLLPAAGPGPCQELSQRVGVTRTQDKTEQRPGHVPTMLLEQNHSQHVFIQRGRLTGTFFRRFLGPKPAQFHAVLLLHDQEESAIVAQTGRVEPGREHVWILLQGSWE